MSIYKKFTLAEIKRKLADGKYKSYAGAMRAIGKTQNLTAEDRTQAKDLVDRAFKRTTTVAKIKTVNAPARTKSAAYSVRTRKSTQREVSLVDLDDMQFFEMVPALAKSQHMPLLRLVLNAAVRAGATLPNFAAALERAS